MGTMGSTTGAIDLIEKGIIAPRKIGKDTDAVADLNLYDGGIRNAGSNLRDAKNVIDGDMSTGWRPKIEDDPSTWFIEVDLGRGVSAKSVTLISLTKILHRSSFLTYSCPPASPRRIK